MNMTVKCWEGDVMLKEMEGESDLESMKNEICVCIYSYNVSLFKDNLKITQFMCMRGLSFKEYIKNW